MLFKQEFNISQKHKTETIIDDQEPKTQESGLYVRVGRQNFDDELVGNEQNESMFGLGGNDRIEGRIGNDFIDGGAGDDKLFGGQDNDTVIGGAGSDIINGGDGDDVLWGHGPSVPQTPLSAVEVDTFVFATNDWGNDKIMDFQDDVDKIEFMQSSGVTYTDLQISQNAAGTLISYDHNGIQSSILLDGFTGLINQDDFIF